MMLHGHGHRAPEAILSHPSSETLQWDVLVLSSSGVMSSIFIRTTDSRTQQSGAEPSERSGAQRDERGACATVVAGVLEGKTDRRCRVDLPGGPLFIEWDEATNKIFMTGPAEFVFSGGL